MNKGKISKVETVDFLDWVVFCDTALSSLITSTILVPVYDAVKQNFGIIRADYMFLLCLSHYPL